jgi:hypothetical protein
LNVLFDQAFDKSEEELIVEVLGMFRSIDKLEFDDERNDFLRLGEVDLFEVELLPHQDLNARYSLGRQIFGVFLPFLNDWGEVGNQLVAQSDVKVLAVVGERLHLVDVADLPNLYQNICT